MPAVLHIAVAGRGRPVAGRRCALILGEKVHSSWPRNAGLRGSRQ